MGVQAVLDSSDVSKTMAYSAIREWAKQHPPKESVMNLNPSDSEATVSISNGTQGLNFEDIQSLDFTMIKLKLQDLEEGQGWPPERCEAVEIEYRKFLALKRTYPHREIVPNRDVDLFWHQHILDTVKYAEDCEKIFGSFLHHYPYFGMNGPDDYSDLCTAFEETRMLYRRHFTEEYGAAAGNRTKCRTKCKPMKCK
jgi:hypothetical protein